MTILRALSSPYDFDITAGGYFHDTPLSVSPHCQDHITFRNGPDIAGVRIPKSRNLWIAGMMAKNDQSTTPEYGFVELFDTAYSTTQPLFKIQKATGNASTARMWVWTGSAWVDSGVNGGAWGTAMMRLDIELVMDGTNGIWRTYRNGVDTISFLGNTDRVASDGIDLVKFGTYTSPAANSDNRMTTWSGILIADEDTRNLFVAQRKPTADGFYTQFTGDYADVVSATYNGLPGDATYLETNADGNRQSFQYGSIADYIFNPIHAVVVSLRNREQQADLAPVTAFLRVDGTDYDSDVRMSAGTSFVGQAAVFADDGVDAWTYEQIEGAEFGVISIPAVED